MKVLNSLQSFRFSLVVVAAFASVCVFGQRVCVCQQQSESKIDSPNIVFIMLDDMGYGDAGCFNPNSKIKTPNIDRLAAGGMRFTDAHAPGAFCVPSRFGLLTGSYPLLRGRNHISSGTETIASFLKSHSYVTAMVGKWHNGFEEIGDWQGKLKGGPVGCGFDYFYGIPHSLDIQPYLFIENDHVVAPPSQTIARGKEVTAGIYETAGWTNIQGAFWRPGNIAPGFKHSEVLGIFTEKANSFLKQHQSTRTGQPFFLYLAYAGPHTPWLPSDQYLGNSGAGLYGDFMTEIDAEIGKVNGTLEQLGYAENTLIMLTSDNGPVWYPENLKTFGHSSAGPLRGMKFDAWEGGHRMPFVASWADKIEPGSVCDQTICFTDVIQTFAGVIGKPLPENMGRDSISFLPLLIGEQNEHARDSLIVPGRAYVSVRKGDFKYMAPRPHRQAAKKQPPREPMLFDLRRDLGETQNILQQQPEIAKELNALLTTYYSRD